MPIRYEIASPVFTSEEAAENAKLYYALNGWDVSEIRIYENGEYGFEAKRKKK